MFGTVIQKGMVALCIAKPSDGIVKLALYTKLISVAKSSDDIVKLIIALCNKLTSVLASMD